MNARLQRALPDIAIVALLLIAPLLLFFPQTLGGQMMLRPSPTVIAVDGVSGTLSKGQWRFDTHRYRGGEAGVIAWAGFDPADSPKLIRKLIAGNTYFSHGFVAATQLGVMRSLRTRVQLLGR